MGLILIRQVNSLLENEFSIIVPYLYIGMLIIICWKPTIILFPWFKSVIIYQEAIESLAKMWHLWLTVVKYFFVLFHVEIAYSNEKVKSEVDYYNLNTGKIVKEVG